MTGPGIVLELDSYRKGGRPMTRLEVATAIRNWTGSQYKVTCDPCNESQKPRSIGSFDLCVTASVCLQSTPSTGHLLLDLLNKLWMCSNRYVLTISLQGTKAGKRVADAHQYFCTTPEEVKLQIEWEKGRVCGNGEFYFQNYTGELNELFIEFAWIAAK